tara:strand:- start:374 stop:1195 length:822 start_codon:yes stop_codon:yes gene_type:complete
MARYFNTNRGKALAISGFGFSVGEIIYPAAVVFLLLTIGWRLTWLSSSIFILIFFGIFFYFIFKINNFKKENNRDEKIDLSEISWRRRDVLKDFKFYMYLPLSLLMSFTVTGFLFHQVYISEIKSWTLINLAQGFIFYAVSGITGSIISGILIDKLTGRKIIPFHLLPMLAIFIVMLFSDHVYVLYLYMAGLGLSNGFTENISNSLWAEMYGVKNLGSIKAMLTFFGIMASASSPFLYGIILDQTNSINTLVYLSLILIILFSLMGYFSKKLK